MRGYLFSRMDRVRLADAMAKHLVHDNHRRVLPKSLWLFAFTLVAYALQNVHGLDGVLMFLLAPFWSLILVNVGFAGIALEVWAGKVNRLWLALPILYICGNLGLAAASHMAFARLEAEMLARNPEGVMSLADDSLVIRTSPHYSQDLRKRLVTYYDIDEVFSEERRHDGVRTRAAGIGVASACGTLAKKMRLDRDAPRVESLREDGESPLPEHRKASPARDMCVYDIVASPKADRVVVAFGEPVERDGPLLRVVTQEIVLTSSSGRVVRLTHAKAYRYGWAPLPIMGCLVGPATPRYCIVDMLRLFPVTASGRNGEPAALIARALGLDAAPASTRRNAILTRQIGETELR